MDYIGVEMLQVHISEYLKTKSQASLAREMGLTAGAVWQMVRDKRDIVLDFDETGKLVSWTNAQKRNPRR